MMNLGMLMMKMKVYRVGLVIRRWKYEDFCGKVV